MSAPGTILISESQEELVLKLKKKINLQIDKLQEFEKNLKKKEEELAHTKQEVIRLQELLNETEQRGAAVKVIRGNNSTILNFTETFCNIISKIIANNEIIPFKNYTKNSARYCKVDRTIFDQYMEQEPGLEKKAFINFCVDFGYFKTDEGRKYVFNDNQIRIYFINKSLITMLEGDETC